MYRVEIFYLDMGSEHTLSSARRLPGNRRRHFGEAGRHSGGCENVIRSHTWRHTAPTLPTLTKLRLLYCNINAKVEFAYKKVLVKINLRKRGIPVEN